MTTVNSPIALVTGAGGFIGGHLVPRLLEDGYRVHALDQKPLEQWHQVHPDAKNTDGCLIRTMPLAWIGLADVVYHLAADMGGIGFTATNDAACSLNILDTAHLAQHLGNEQRIFYSSSACVYPISLQHRLITKRFSLREEDVGPPYHPDHLYGHEKLFGELMLTAHAAKLGFALRTARYHNVYGPHGDWDGGREKAPAAICRKVALAKLTGQDRLSVWGDGEQVRSFMHVTDCIEGTRRLMDSDVAEPLNLGSEEWVTINSLVETVAEIAGYRPGELKVTHDLSGPQGVRGRNSDNTLINERLGWEPGTTLVAGLQDTYAWIHDQVKETLK